MADLDDAWVVKHIQADIAVLVQHIQELIEVLNKLEVKNGEKNTTD